VATHTVSAVLFAKDFQRVASFYREVFCAQLLRSDAEHEVLECLGFHLVIHQIPQTFAPSTIVTAPPKRRERAAIRLDFPVADMEKSRGSAQRLGGQIDEEPPSWAAADEMFFLGHDPEGNVIGVMPADKSLQRTRG
jgi:predicted enzyme related to lactoylglutathione lyase